MYRIVVDTSVIVSALRSRLGASNVVLGLVARRRLVPLISPALFLEYEEVLKRPEHRLAHRLEVEQVDRFLAALASAAEPVDAWFQWRPQLSDPDDEMVLETAVNGRADAILTHNVRDFASAGSRFGIRTLKPREFLLEIGS